MSDFYKHLDAIRRIADETFQPTEAKAKPDFLDLDKDGDKTEPMKSAAKEKEVKEDPETDYKGSFEYELYGDDGETAYGTIHYRAVNGRVDPKSLQGEYEYEGNARVDSDLATQMIQPGGDEHDEALKAAQEDYEYESKNKKESQGSIDDEYRFRDWLKKTHNKQVHELKPQEYAIISKQYRDETGKKESNAPDMVIRDPDDEADDKDQEIAKDQEEAEKINKELDRIKNLAGLGEEETVKEKDEPADVGLSPQAQDYAEKPDDEDEADYVKPSEEHYKKALAAGYKGSYEDYVKEYGSFPEEFPKNEASKPDFLDMDKDGDKTEPMKKAIKDKEAKEDTDLTAIRKLAGI